MKVYTQECGGGCWRIHAANTGASLTETVMSESIALLVAKLEGYQLVPLPTSFPLAGDAVETARDAVETAKLNLRALRLSEESWQRAAYGPSSSRMARECLEGSTSPLPNAAKKLAEARQRLGEAIKARQ